jgi:hypothetical protein
MSHRDTIHCNAPCFSGLLSRLRFMEFIGCSNIIDGNPDDFGAIIEVVQEDSVESGPGVSEFIMTQLFQNPKQMNLQQGKKRI